MESYSRKFNFRYYVLPLCALSVYCFVASLLQSLDTLSYLVLALIYFTLSSFFLFVFLSRCLNLDYYQISKEKIIVRTIFVKREFPFSRYSLFRISRRSFITSRGIYAKNNLTGKDSFVIPQFGTPDNLERILEIISKLNH